MKLNPVIGFYGKLPMQTEMVAKNLPAEFINPWQNWLQTALTASHDTLGLDWLNSYLTAPIWRFILNAGLCGDSAWAGILMSSMDKEGNYFPLTVVAPFESSLSLPHLFTLGNHWFEQLETLAISGLDYHVDLQEFVRLLEAIPVFPLPKTASHDNHLLYNYAGEKSLRVTMKDISQVAETFVEMNASLLNAFFSGYSLWATSGSEHVQSVLAVYDGLPPTSGFSTFLNSQITDKKKTKRWASWVATDIGKRRSYNEDALLAKPEACLWAVADGMGGHKAGDVASQLIVNSLNQLSLETSLETNIHTVKQCLQQVNGKLRQFAREQYENHIVGSTVVALICEADYCAVLWAGDSRLYRLRSGTLQQLTQDHSADYGKGAKNTNIITKAIGAAELLEVDCNLFDVLEDDLFLLCSDGLDKEVSFDEIEHVMKTCQPHEIATTLLARTLNNGARDNVTVVVVSGSS